MIHMLKAACMLLCVLAASDPCPAQQYGQLDPSPYDPETEPDIDMFFGHWEQSLPRHSHGSLVERDILTRGDPLEPPRPGAVLKYVNRFVHATLEAGAVTTPTTLEGEQEIFFVIAGKGEIRTETTTAALYKGITVLVPGECEFVIENTGAESLKMYLVSEPYPENFRVNDDIRVVDENAAPITTSDSHWVGIVKQLFSTRDGLGTLESIITVYFSPMTFFHPHSHVPGTEEVWIPVDKPLHVLFGKEIREQRPGMAYLIPTTGETPHANFNVSDHTIRMFYFARYGDHELRK